jgi:general secretion pathway protein N
MAIVRVKQPLERGAMRSPAILAVTFCALAATAAAGPIDEPARPPAGVAGALAAGLPRASDPGGKPRAGNPLWTVPLSALPVTRDRPLFSVSRRPPAVAGPVAAPAPKQEAIAPPPPERPLLTLIGTIVSQAGSLAMLQGSNADTISRLRLGQENDGWRVRGIGLRSIVVEKGEQSVELGLPRSDGAPAQDAGGPPSPPPPEAPPRLPDPSGQRPSHHVE